MEPGRVLEAEERRAGVSGRRLLNRSRFRAGLSLTLGIAAVLMAVVLATWAYATPADAASPSTTTLSEDEPVDSVPDLGTTSTLTPIHEVIPPSGPVLPSAALDPSAPREFVDHSNCLSCHGDPSLSGLMTKTRPDGSSIALYVDSNALSYSVHRFNDCTTCHTTKPHEVQTPLTKLSLAEKCGSCHQYQYGQYIKSVHGAPQASGNDDPASCVDCHSSNSNPHNIVRVLDPAATIYPKNIAETCAKCHDNPELMNKYGIVEKVYDSYMNSFHGKAMSLSGQSASLQQLNKATCVNCHGAHNIAMVTDPNAPVAGMENLAKTCEQCHPGAGVEFVKGFLGHKEAEPNHIPQVFWGEKFFFVFTRVVLAGGVVLVVGPLARRGVDRVKGRKKPPEKDQEEE